MKGKPSALISGTIPPVAPWLLIVKSNTPVRKLVSIETSLPSCSEPATFIVTAPFVFAATSSANFSAPTERGLPGAAPCPRVKVTAACDDLMKAGANGAAAKAPAVAMKLLRVILLIFVSFDIRYYFVQP